MKTRKAYREDRYYDIIRGPAKNVLLETMKKTSATRPMLIKLQVAAGYACPLGGLGCAAMPLRIRQIAADAVEFEDGSGNRFNIYGICEVDEGPLYDKEQYEKKRFIAFYDTKRESGTIRFL